MQVGWRVGERQGGAREGDARQGGAGDAVCDVDIAIDGGGERGARGVPRHVHVSISPAAVVVGAEQRGPRLAGCPLATLISMAYLYFGVRGT